MLTAVSLHLCWKPWPITRRARLCNHTVITKTSVCVFRLYLQFYLCNGQMGSDQCTWGDWHWILRYWLEDIWNDPTSQTEIADIPLNIEGNTWKERGDTTTRPSRSVLHIRGQTRPQHAREPVCACQDKTHLEMAGLLPLTAPAPFIQPVVCAFSLVSLPKTPECCCFLRNFAGAQEQWDIRSLSEKKKQKHIALKKIL